jgi:hypothetical protein
MAERPGSGPKEMRRLNGRDLAEVDLVAQKLLAAGHRGEHRGAYSLHAHGDD